MAKRKTTTIGPPPPPFAIAFWFAQSGECALCPNGAPCGLFASGKAAAQFLRDVAREIERSPKGKSEKPSDGC